MKGYEITMVNHLSSKIKAKKCSDLQSRIPALDTGYYVFLSVSGKQATSKLISKRCTSVASLIPAITHIL